MYAIKAHFDGQKITPSEEIPVNKPYEAIITFTEPAKEAEKPKKSLLDFVGIFDDKIVETILQCNAESRGMVYKKENKNVVY